MHPLVRASLAVVVAAIVLGPLTVHAAPYTYSAAALSSDFFISFDTFVDDTSATGPATAEIGSAPDLFARTQTAFGVNRGFWQATGQSTQQAGALSIWSDQFTVTGGSGGGAAHMDFRVDGTIASCGVGVIVPCHTFEGFFAMLRSETAPDVDALLAAAAANVFGDFIPPDGATILLIAEASTDDGDFGPHHAGLSGPLDFTYGEAFFLTGIVGAYATENGMGDFFGTARLEITVPTGALLVTASGTTYAAAVPEAASLLLLAVGLTALGVARRGRVRAD